MISKPKIKVETPTTINDTDLADLCDITEQAINAGGGFGWLKTPQRKILIKYWKGTVLIPNRKLIVGRINKAIAGTLQLIFHPKNNEAQQNFANISSHFVAPWARGFGLAKEMIRIAEQKALLFGSDFIHLDIRETQSAAIKLFESQGYKKWGTNPYYAIVGGKNLKGYYFYKKIK